uniref:Uncharacterized protein n=1 Tax=Cacopsylla melanoneura TaxID=428564 RepID=A0A8D8ZGW9_9HEMI
MVIIASRIHTLISLKSNTKLYQLFNPTMEFLFIFTLPKAETNLPPSTNLQQSFHLQFYVLARIEPAHSFLSSKHFRSLLIILVDRLGGNEPLPAVTTYFFFP